MKNLKIFVHIFCVIAIGYNGFILIQAHATWFILSCFIFMIAGFIFLTFCYVREKEAEMVKYKLQKDGEVQQIRDKLRVESVNAQKSIKDEESIYKEKTKKLEGELRLYKGGRRDTRESPEAEVNKMSTLTGIHEITNPSEVYAIGDIHSNYLALIAVLESLLPTKVPIILLGDLLSYCHSDNGIKVLQKIRQIYQEGSCPLIPIMGNHDHAYAEWLIYRDDKMKDFLYQKGGGTTLRGLYQDKKLLDWFKNFLLSMFVSYRIGNCIFVHAGFRKVILDQALTAQGGLGLILQDHRSYRDFRKTMEADFGEETTKNILWNWFWPLDFPDVDVSSFYQQTGLTVIYGHSPTIRVKRYEVTKPIEHVGGLGIDFGSGLKGGKLGLLKIRDAKKLNYLIDLF